MRVVGPQDCPNVSCVSLPSRLYVLQGGLAQQEWRVPELLHRLLQYLEPKLTQVYKNVRERIGRYMGPFTVSPHIHPFSYTDGRIILLNVFLTSVWPRLPPSVLTYIFMIDVSLPSTQPTNSPRIADFTRRVVARLKPLTEGDEEIQNHVMEENDVGEQDERTQAIKLLKTGGQRRTATPPTLTQLSRHIALVPLANGRVFS